MHQILTSSYEKKKKKREKKRDIQEIKNYWIIMEDKINKINK